MFIRSLFCATCGDRFLSSTKKKYEKCVKKTKKLVPVIPVPAEPVKERSILLHLSTLVGVMHLQARLTLPLRSQGQAILAIKTRSDPQGKDASAKLTTTHRRRFEGGSSINPCVAVLRVL